jgi:hypothetical protein
MNEFVSLCPPNLKGGELMQYHFYDLFKFVNCVKLTVIAIRINTLVIDLL